MEPIHLAEAERVPDSVSNSSVPIPSQVAARALPQAVAPAEVLVLDLVALRVARAPCSGVRCLSGRRRGVRPVSPLERPAHRLTARLYLRRYRRPGRQPLRGTHPDRGRELPNAEARRPRLPEASPRREQRPGSETIANPKCGVNGYHPGIPNNIHRTQ